MGIGDLISNIAGTGELVKLRIVSFESRQQARTDGGKLSAANGDEDNVFEAFYNPSSFSIKLGISRGDSSTIAGLGSTMKFNGYGITTYAFNLMLDGTGASVPSGSYAKAATRPNVNEMITKFKKVAYEYDGDKHEPPYLRLEWGKSSVERCVLTSATIDYDLFKPDGTPLRATIQCDFAEYFTEEELSAFKGNNSPDMTHIRVVKQGDRLPLMCEAIYGDASLYLEVARANSLTNYRNLIPGQKIFFPPLVTPKT